MTTILLVRHGETAHNAAGIWQGHSDIPLSDFGRTQAHALRVHLPSLLESPTLPVLFVSSDLCRATETADIIRLNVQSTVVQQDADLRERGYGSWEGKSRETCARLWPEHTRPHDGESWNDVVIRMRRGFHNVLQRSHLYNAAVIVGHGASLKAIVAHVLYPNSVLPEPPACIMSNTGVTVLRLGDDSVWRVTSLNDVSHIKKG